jgi:CelD/BcsL family acetyltransferase involved in cellulose biosynthesis
MSHVFATPEWLETWWKHFGRGRRLDQNLYEWRRRPLKILRFVGHGPSDLLGPPGDPDEAEPRLRELLARERPHLFLGEQLPAAHRWATRLDARILRRHGSPVLRFAGETWDELLASRSKNLRAQAGRFERKLEREHGLRYRLGGADEIDVLFALHRARWPADKSDFGRGEQLNAFHRDFAQQAQDKGWLRLWFLEAGGKTVAAWYGWRYDGAEHYYQAGRDPAFEGASVGFVLLCHSIRAALEDGAAEYRFLRGGEHYKYRFATDDPQIETIALTRGPIAGLGLSAADALRKARRARP